MILAVALLLCGGVATAGIMVARTVADKARQAKDAIPKPGFPDPDVFPSTVPELPGLPTELPTDVPTGRKITVTYEVTGKGPAAILYLEKLGDAPTRLDEVSLPWKFTTSMETPALVSVTAMRADTAKGTVSCRALVDGKPVRQATSAAGRFATASCTYFALD